jgi:hypothetical protein
MDSEKGMGIIGLLLKPKTHKGLHLWSPLAINLRSYDQIYYTHKAKRKAKNSHLWKFFAGIAS